MQTPVQAAWKRVDAWFECNSANAFVQFKPGATLKQIESLEALIGSELPQEFKESLQIHNGTYGVESFLFIDNSTLLTIEDIGEYWLKFKREYLNENGNVKEEWNVGVTTDKGIQDQVFHPAWIPFACITVGNIMFIDLAPTSNGLKGQIIYQTDIDNLVILAPSFTKLLEQFADELEQGKWAVNETEWLIELIEKR